MSEAALETDVVDDHHGDHPSDLDYVKIFIALVVLTAIEVATFFIDMPTPMLIGAVAILMSIKIYLICSSFMHLKIDDRLFTRVFVAGLLFAIVVYAVMLSTFALWDQFDF